MKTPLIALMCIAVFVPAFAAPSTNTVSASGKISAVKKTSITIAVGNGDTLKSFKITKKTKIKVDEREANVEALKAGMVARVEALENTDPKDSNKDKEAVEISAKSGAGAAAKSDPFAVPPIAPAKP